MRLLSDPDSEETMVDSVRCTAHGNQQATLVCQHIFDGLAHRKRVGFFWTICDPDNPRPDAWCVACEERVRATNGDWIDQSLEHLQPKVLCGACYDLAKEFHLGGNPWS
jgi:hypothetical protein